jgi:hypothetical protein
MILIVTIIIASALSKALCDRIRFKADFGGDWINARGNYRYDKRTFWTKYVFSFVSDGWHFFDAVRVLSLCILATICLSIPVYCAIGIYIIHGLIFELIYSMKV